jgi:DNA primase
LEIPFYLSPDKGVKPEDIEKVGLIKKSEKIKSDYYDRFRGRIMFPIFDASGRVVAFSGRQFESDGTEAKYINSPETVLFEKSKILYGYDKAKLEIRRQDYTVLVEGQMDLIMSHQGGLANTVASSGTALTKEQLEILKRLSHRLIIAYDGDAAGLAAAARGWQLALEAGMEIKIALLPQGKDPADLVLEDPEVYKNALRNAEHIITVELARILKTHTDPREQGLAVQKELLPYVRGLESSIEQSHFITQIAHKALIKEDVLWQEVRKEGQKSHYRREEQPPQQLHKLRSRRASIERMLFAIMYWQERQTEPQVSPLDIRAKMCNILDEDTIKKFEVSALKVKDELVFEAEVAFLNSTTLEHTVKELLESLEEDHLREQFALAMQKMQEAEHNKDTDTVLKLLKVCQDISTKLRNLTTNQNV